VATGKDASSDPGSDPELDSLAIEDSSPAIEYPTGDVVAGEKTTLWRVWPVQKILAAN
jgi:hypothetical protein